MTQRRPNLDGLLRPGADSSTTPVKIEQMANSDKVHQVPEGLDSRGFALHRIFCNAGEPRCPACLAKYNLPAAPAIAQQERYTRTVQVAKPMGSGVLPNDRGQGLRFEGLLPDGNAAAAGICEGDIAVCINSVFVKSMPFDSAVAIIKSSPSSLTVIVSSLVEEPAALKAASAADAAPAPEESEPAPMEIVPEEKNAAEPVAPPSGPNAEGSTIVALRRGAGGLGMGLKPADESRDTGLLVGLVAPGGAADLTGRITPGDRIISINGTVVTELRHSEAVGLLVGPSELQLEIAATVAARPEADPRRDRVALTVKLAAGGDLGATVCAASADGTLGLEVVSVSPGGLAKSAGLLPGDRVVKADGAPVESERTVVVVRQLAEVGVGTVVVARPSRSWAI